MRTLAEDIKPDNPALDDTGKADFNDIYDADDPHLYYTTMQTLDYCIPEQARPLFEKMIEEIKQQQKTEEKLNILDIGASYGVNGALLKWGMSLQDLFSHHRQPAASPSSSHGRRLLERYQLRDDINVTGLDVSARALRYAQDCNLIDQSISVDLEVDEADDNQAELIRRTDLIISTGCIGYVTDTSLRKLLTFNNSRKAWMAHCILRMFDIEPYQRLFAEYGYHVWQHPVLLRQRRFASEEEQDQVLKNLKTLNIDTRGYESEGYLYARMLFAMPLEIWSKSGR